MEVIITNPTCFEAYNGSATCICVVFCVPNGNHCVCQCQLTANITICFISQGNPDGNQHTNNIELAYQYAYIATVVTWSYPLEDLYFYCEGFTAVLWINWVSISCPKLAADFLRSNVLLLCNCHLKSGIFYRFGEFNGMVDAASHLWKNIIPKSPHFITPSYISNPVSPDAFQ